MNGPLRQPDRPALADVVRTFIDAEPFVLWRARECVHTAVVERLLTAGLWSDSAPVDLLTLRDLREALTVASLGIEHAATIAAIAGSYAHGAIDDYLSLKPEGYAAAVVWGDAAEYYEHDWWWKRNGPRIRTREERDAAEMGFALVAVSDVKPGPLPQTGRDNLWFLSHVVIVQPPLSVDVVPRGFNAALNFRVGMWGDGTRDAAGVPP